MERIVMHIDVNNAFLSWTAVDLLSKGYPVDIRKVPSIIGGDESQRKGIVLAKSPVAKKMGIKTADTIYSAKRICKDLKIFPPDFRIYSEKSNKLFELIKSYTPDIEQASIDECYLEYTNVKNIYGDEKEFAINLKNRIKKEFGFTVNIGIANNKLCAKMASDFEKPDKVHTLYMNEIETKMFPLPIEDLFTVGKSTSAKLRSLGINTIGKLAKMDPYNLKYTFKNNSTRLVEIANGIDDSKVDTNTFIPKGISNEITLNEDISTKKELNRHLKELSLKVSKRIRNEDKYAKVICVILKDNKFKRYSHQKKLKNPVNSFEDIYKYSKEVLDEFYNNEKVRLIGIRLDNLVNNKSYQTSLFEKEKNDNVDKIIDDINKKYGKDIIKRASFIENNK